jgi:hypothetical protein
LKTGIKEGALRANKKINGGFFIEQIKVKKSEFENDQLNGFSLIYKKYYH